MQKTRERNLDNFWKATSNSGTSQPSEGSTCTDCYGHIGECFVGSERIIASLVGKVVSRVLNSSSRQKLSCIG